MYNKGQKKAILLYNTKSEWCLKRHPNVIERYIGGITITMVCKGMRKIKGKNYGFAWQSGQAMMKNGIHTLHKAKEVSDMLLNEYGVFVPYIELVGFRDIITDTEDGSEI